MKENIRQALTRIRAQAYNEGLLAGRAEGYAAATKELEEVLGSVPHTSAAPKRKKRNTNASIKVQEYLEQNAGARIQEITRAASCTGSVVYKAARAGAIKRIGSRFYPASYQQANSAHLEEQPNAN